MAIHQYSQPLCQNFSITQFFVLVGVRGMAAMHKFVIVYIFDRRHTTTRPTYNGQSTSPHPHAHKHPSLQLDFFIAHCLVFSVVYSRCSGCVGPVFLFRCPPLKCIFTTKLLLFKIISTILLKWHQQTFSLEFDQKYWGKVFILPIGHVPMLRFVGVKIIRHVLTKIRSYWFSQVN